MRYVGDADTQKKIYDTQSDEVIRTLLWIYGENFAEGDTNLYLTNFDQNVTSTLSGASQLYQTYPFMLALEGEKDKSVTASAQLIVSTIGLNARIIRELRRQHQPPIVRYYTVKFSDLNTSLANTPPEGYIWTTVSGNSKTAITGELTPSESPGREPSPWQTYTKEQHPGLFGNL